MVKKTKLHVVLQIRVFLIYVCFLRYKAGRNFHGIFVHLVDRSLYRCVTHKGLLLSKYNFHCENEQC